MAEKTIEEIQALLEAGKQLEAQDAKRVVDYLKLNKQRKQSLDYLQEEVKNLEQQQKFVNALSQEQGRLIEKEKIELELQEAKNEILKKSIIEQAKGRDLTAQEIKDLIGIEKQLDKVNEKKKDIARAEGAGETLAKLLGISESNKNSLTYQMFKNPKLVMDGFKGAIQDAGGLSTALFTSIAMKAQEAAAAILLITKQQITMADQSVSSFYAATGANESYTKSIYEVGRGNTALGIGFQQSGKAITDLYTNLNTFTTLNKSTKESLVLTTAKLEKLGISGGDTAKSIASLSVMMGISENQAAKTVERFAAMGQAIGVSSKQMISDFMGVKDQLAVFGSAMDSTFIKLEAQAKATGVAVNDLLALTNKFDTFEGAASQVAKLNAILGGPYLSAMSMIETTDPTERINMLRQAVNNAGMSFQSMSYYEKKAIADAGGFKSIEEAQRILSMSAGEAAEELQKQQASQKALNEAIERAQPIQEKLTMIMANFAIVMEPVVTGISNFLTYILELQDEIPGFGIILGVIGFAFSAIAFALIVAIPLLTALPGLFTLLGTTAAPAAVGAEAAAVGISSAASTLAAATPIIVKGSAGLGIFALALLGVGAAVLLVGLGFKAMLEGFAAVLEQGVKAPDIFLNMAIGILALTAAIYALSINPLAFLGIANLVAAVYGISKAINSIETEKVIAFKTVMEKSVEISEPSTIQGFEKFSEKFEAVAKATANVDASRTQSFANLLIATQNLSQAFKVNTTVNVKIGDKKFEAVVEEIVDKKMGDASINGSS